MGTVSLSPESEAARRAFALDMLQTAMGPILGWLEDPAIVEVMLNPDGHLWIDRLAGGIENTGERLSAEAGERIVKAVADHVGAEVTSGSPRVSAELPTGERFEGMIAPVVTAPAFTIRKHAVAVFTLEDYVAAGTMSLDQAAILRGAVRHRRNILVAGGTGSGKTTLTNALLAEIARTTSDRVLILEDTRELQCLTPNRVEMRTIADVISLPDLVRSSLRQRPNRIIIGEVRGGEALELVKAWGTGHPGGIGTIHAGSAAGALYRLEQLIQEVVAIVPRALIAETINVIAVLTGRGAGRRLVELAEIKGLESANYVLRQMSERNIEGDHP